MILPMRRSKLTARPGRAARYGGAFGLLMLSSALAPSGQAMQTAQPAAATPDAATKAAMDKRRAARTLLSSALARIAANANDSTALLDAGRASIDLEDHRAALSFLLRAEQLSPRDGAVKAALGSAMVHLENPARALDYFGEAQLLGVPERLMLSDRGLARDLLGQQDAAQRDYQLALSIAANDETLRRYALSLGISGDVDRAIQTLTPQLRAQDRAAWRSRAMILAMNGRDKEAADIVNATLPPALAQNILPYLVQMDRLNPAQQAAAVHFGRFPTGELGPKRRPVQVAAATPAPAPAPIPATSSRRSGRSERTGAVPTQQRLGGRAAPAAKTPAPPPAPVPAVKAPTPAPAATAASVTVAAAPPPTPVPVPAPVAAAQPSAVPPVASAVPVPAPTPAPAPAAAPASAPAPIGVAIRDSAEPVGPGFSISDMGRQAAPVAAASAPAAPSPVPPAAAPLASLAEIAGSIEIPPEELSRPDNAIGADVLARLQEEKRRAEAAEAAKREKEAAAAKAKAEAEAKAKEEAAQKKANPARLWVQIATGADEKALAFDYGRFAKKSPEVFKGKAGATTEWNRTRRLLVGPFADRKAAQDWLSDYKKAGGDGFLFNSEAGETVDPVK